MELEAPSIEHHILSAFKPLQARENSCGNLTAELIQGLLNFLGCGTYSENR